jgi:hypothetical protein
MGTVSQVPVPAIPTNQVPLQLSPVYLPQPKDKEVEWNSFWKPSWFNFLSLNGAFTLASRQAGVLSSPLPEMVVTSPPLPHASTSAEQGSANDGPAHCQMWGFL